MSSGVSVQPRFPHVTALDGLRGVALLGVLLFHADGALPGGYLGVDLFFVLSGYLITALLLAEHAQTGRIDLWAFWGRRCRRLFPALLALMPAVAIYGRFWAQPEELASLRQQALASLGYYANWLAIASHRSYWQLFAAPSPLEHTWSLAIEEQFYLLWPPLVALVLWRRSARSLLALSLTLGGASMLAMLYCYQAGSTNRAYLGTDTRMAAVLAGAALATFWRPGVAVTARRARLLNTAALVAACVLALAWCKLDGNSPLLYRGGFWLCQAAALVLIACVTSGSSLVSAVLSLPPLTWLGTISYGMYLWHWPVDVVLSAERSGLHGVSLQIVRLLLTLLIAMVSFRVVEQPIRRGGLPFGRPQYMLPAAVMLAIFLVVHATYARGRLATVPRTPPEGAPLPSALESGSSYRMLVFGDSTANSLGWGLRALHHHGLAVELLGRDGCSMLSDSCNGDQWAKKARELRPDATLVYLAGAFLYGFDDGGAWRTACQGDWNQRFEATLERRLRELLAVPGKVFLVTAPYPVGRWDTAEYRGQIDCINATLAQIARRNPALKLIDLHHQLCGRRDACELQLPDGAPLRPDGVHFSIAGAEHVAKWVAAQVQVP